MSTLKFQAVLSKFTLLAHSGSDKNFLDYLVVESAHQKMVNLSHRKDMKIFFPNTSWSETSDFDPYHASQLTGDLFSEHLSRIYSAIRLYCVKDG